MRVGLLIAALGGCSGSDDTGKGATTTPPTDPTGGTTPEGTTPTVDTDTTDSGWTYEGSDPGDPLAVDPTGWVYSVDLAGGTWVEPVGLGPLIGAALATTGLLVSPTAFRATEVDLLAALGVYDVQDPCVATVSLPGSPWTDPVFSTSAPTLELTFFGVPLALNDVTFTGTFQPDGERIGGAELAGQLDTRTLGALLGLGTDEGATCDLVAAFGVSCLPCPDGLPYCLDVDITDLGAPHLPGVTLIERTDADIAADPACAY
jgi:hypothetical protein